MIRTLTELTYRVKLKFSFFIPSFSLLKSLLQCLTSDFGDKAEKAELCEIFEKCEIMRKVMTKPEEEPQTECPGVNELPWRVSRASALKLNGTEI